MYLRILEILVPIALIWMEWLILTMKLKTNTTKKYEIGDRQILRELSKVLGVREEEIPRALEKRKKETEDNERKIRELLRG